MSLLMDALKKAEKEKSRVNSSGESVANFPEQVALPDDALIVSPSETFLTADLDSAEELVDPNDESWTFDSDEIELEPITKKLSDADIEGDKEPDHSNIDDDVTLIEPMPTDEDFSDAIQDIEPDLTLQSEIGIHKSDLDHDTTLPSERAIQSSLKDYFEASQSITLDQNSVNAAPPDITEHSITSTSPLDTSATHVTAHTIFTAGQSRPMSTGLGKYAMFGTLALGIGLGSVALYYSSVTPKVILMPTNIASVDHVVEANTKQPTKTIKVNNVKETTTATVEIEDAVLAEIVKELPSVKPNPQSAEPLQEAPAAESDNTRIEAVPQRGATIALNEEPIVINSRTVSPITIQPTLQQTTSAKPRLTTQTNNTADLSEYQTRKIAELEETIIRNAREYQTKTSKESYRRNEPVFTSNQPIEVMSAADFSEGLHVPKSAIKITKGRSRSASRSDLDTAYQAYQAGDFITAKSAYRRVLSRRPDSRDARLGIAAIAVMEGNHETAYRNYHYLLQQNPQDQVVNAALFNLKGNTSGHTNESQLKMSLDQNPSSPQVHFSLGSFYAGQTRWPEAQQAFFDAYSADKNNGDYAYNLAVSLDQMGQAKSALSYYRTALKLADNHQVSFNTSQVLARIQKLSGIVKN